MKKFLALTTSLCAFVCALGFGGASIAFADGDDADGLQYYPDTFERVPEFSSLDDYAVGSDGKILFLQKNVISEYGNERVVTYTNSNAPILSLYFENGEFYYGTDDANNLEITYTNASLGDYSAVCLFCAILAIVVAAIVYSCIRYRLLGLVNAIVILMHSLTIIVALLLIEIPFTVAGAFFAVASLALMCGANFALF